MALLAERLHIRLYWASRLVIPIIMMLMVGRAAYLSSEYNLSTWKGGGMGMFASADSAATRFAQVTIEAPTGGRYPISRLTPEQNTLSRAALWYPRRENFVPLANSIRATQWATQGTAEPVRHYNSNGKLLRTGPESKELLSHFGIRPADEPTDFVVIIDFYSMSYEVGARKLQANLIDSFRFEQAE